MDIMLRMLKDWVETCLELLCSKVGKDHPLVQKIPSSSSIGQVTLAIQLWPSYALFW